MESVRREIRKSFESEEYESRRENEVKNIQQQKEELFRRLNEEAQKEGFAINMSTLEVVTIPLRDGKPMSQEELFSLSPEEKQEINRRNHRLQDRLKISFRQMRSIDKSAGEELQKIEGFYEICRAKGLTGRQGALIPMGSARNLMLKEEVAEAVRDGKFNVWAVGHIDEGIEILTGRKAGERKNGKFEEASVNDLIDRHLKRLSETMRHFVGPGGGKSKKSAG